MTSDATSRASRSCAGLKSQSSSQRARPYRSAMRKKKYRQSACLMSGSVKSASIADEPGIARAAQLLDQTNTDDLCCTTPRAGAEPRLWPTRKTSKTSPQIPKAEFSGIQSDRPLRMPHRFRRSCRHAFHCRTRASEGHRVRKNKNAPRCTRHSDAFEFDR